MEFEGLLQRYRAIGPPDDLRDRIVALTPARPGRSLAAWFVSAAAGTAAAILYVLAGRIGDQIAQRAGDADRSRAAAVVELGELLGGDEAAHFAADRVVPRTLQVPPLGVDIAPGEGGGERRD
jgi:hypothetical protein